MASGDKHSRTEKPTAKRKKETRKKGQVPRSPDVAGWAAVVLATFLLPWYFGTVEGRVIGLMAQASQAARSPSASGAVVVLEAGLRVLLLSVAPLGAIFAVLAIVANLAQTGPVFSFQAARPKFSRVSPKTGVQRLFSPATAIQLLKQVVKVLVLGAAGYMVLNGLIHEMVGLQPVSLGPILGATASSVLSFVRILALIGLAIGLLDYFYQRHHLAQNMKMTKDEVKEERRSSDGDPVLKAMIRKRMFALARSRVLAAVRNADVVVTNPTHYAVALQYEAGHRGAPRVVAKGSDLLAGRIRDEAARFDVPVVEDPPLARYLYAICETNDQIPAEIYLAVARLLAFVYSLPAMVRGAGVHHPPASLVPLEPAALAEMSEDRRERLVSVLAGGANP